MKRDRGQLAIGLAMAFTAVCAIFGMLFNSAMMTREKMKLQQTSDFAALVAADVQRRFLNDIFVTNEAIDKRWKYYLPFVEKAWAAPFAATMNIQGFKDFSDNITQKKSASCSEAGHNLDHFLREQVVDAYRNGLYGTEGRDAMAQKIQIEVFGANLMAHEMVLKTFYEDKNLPHGLRRLLARALGQNPSPEAIRSALNGGPLSDSLTIADSMNYPLFVPDEEKRPFIVFKYAYEEVVTYYKNWCMGGFAPNGVETHDAYAKVARKNDSKLTTHYLVSALYSPPNTLVDERFAYKLKKPNADFGDMEITDKDQRTLRLFNVTDEATGERKTLIQSVALAKPFGGSFPKGGGSDYLPGGFWDYGTAGSEFKGSKLIGIADYKRELEGFKMPLEKELPTGETRVLEDFLH